MRTVYFNTSFEEVSEKEAVYRLDKYDERLDFGKLTEGEWRFVQPFTFGNIFETTHYSGNSLSRLRSYVPKLEHNEAMLNQMRVIPEYLKDEFGKELSRENIELLVELYWACFPVTVEWSVGRNSCILYDGFYGTGPATAQFSFFKATNYRDFVQEIFGVARKDTLRETRKLNVEQLIIARLFRDLLPPEHIIEDLTHNEYFMVYGYFTPEPYEVLSRLSLHHRRKLLRSFSDEASDNYRLIEDTLFMLGETSAENIKRLKGYGTWDSLHDRLMNITDVAAIETSAISIPEKLLALGGKEIALKETIVPLMNAREYIKVGNDLNICLGKSNYYTKARRGESYCFTVLKDRKIQAAVEIAKDANLWKVIQFRGYRNELVDNFKEKKTFIEDFLNGEN